jgi:hypothetical protein
MSVLRITKLGALALLPLGNGHPTGQVHDGLLVHTDLFAVKGVLWSDSSDVRFFGGVPYR